MLIVHLSVHITCEMQNCAVLVKRKDKTTGNVLDAQRTRTIIVTMNVLVINKKQIYVQSVN